MNFDYIFLDTETTGLEIYSGKIQCTGIGYMIPATEQKGFLYRGPMQSWDDKSGLVELADLQHAINKYTPVFFNPGFDIAVLEKLVGLYIPSRYEAVDLMYRVLMPKCPSYKLKELAGQFLHWTDYSKEFAVLKWMKDENKELEKGDEKLQKGAAPRKLLEPYCLEDVEMTMQLFYLLYDRRFEK